MKGQRRVQPSRTSRRRGGGGGGGVERPSPAHGAKKRVVLGVQGPAGGYHASATGRDAPTKPLGQTITVVPRYCPISGPSICCSSCLKSPSHLFLPGLRVSSWVGALSLLVSLPRNRSPALPGALLPVRCRSAPRGSPRSGNRPPHPPHPSPPPPRHILISCGFALGKQGKGIFQ